MLTIFSLLIIAFLVAFTTTPLVRNIALAYGLVDLPDGIRKLHARAVPRVGGVAVILGYMLSLSALAAIRPHALDDNQPAFQLVWNILPAVGVVFLTGLIDDFLTLGPWQKLLGEFAAAALACAAGVHITEIGGTDIPDWAGVPLTFAWLIVCTNAFNLIDGLDGLASGIGLFATLTVLAAGLLHGDLGLAVATAPLAGALAGFLRYNLSPATVFLGDAGSLSVGLLLGCYGVVWSHKATTLLGVAGPLMAMSVPLFDTTLAITRRFLRAKPIFSPDRAHIHHRLLDLGLTPKGVVLSLYGVSGVAAGFALLYSAVPNEWRAVVLLLFGASAWAGIKCLRYHEFRAVGEIFRPRVLRRLLNDQLRLGSLQESLSCATTPDDYWRAVRDAARDFGFNSIQLELRGRTYTECLRDGRSSKWAVTVPLQGSDYIHLTREFQSPETAVRIAPFFEFLYSSMAVRGEYAGLIDRDGTEALDNPGDQLRCEPAITAEPADEPLKALHSSSR